MWVILKPGYLRMLLLPFRDGFLVQIHYGPTTFLPMKCFLQSIAENGKFLLLLLVFWGTCTYLPAQSYLPSYHQDQGNPGGLNPDGVSITTGWTEILGGGQDSNRWAPVQALPFSFSFFGTPVTHFKASTNGIITFDTAAPAPPNAPQALPTDSLPSQSIAVFWEEFTGSPPTGTNDHIYTKTFGAAPNRQFWIKWSSFELGNPAVAFVNMSCVLEEGSQNIYVVDEYSLASGTFQGVAGLQENNGNAIQAGGGFVTFAGNATPLADNDYYQFTFLPTLDLSLAEILNPVKVCAGNDSLLLRVHNAGVDTVDSFEISYSLNGGASVSQTFSTQLLSGESDTVNLGSINFSPGTTYGFDFFITAVNGTTDSETGNDSLSTALATGLSGPYTVNAGQPASVSNFQSVQAIAAYMTANGICGPVDVAVAAGTYNAAVVFGEIAGASATNTITISGQSTSGTLLQYNGTATQATIEISGADHLTFKHLKIKSSYPYTSRWGFHLSNASDYITIDSCTIELPISATMPHGGIVASSDLTTSIGAGNNANHLTVSNCRIYGGGDGIHLEGTEVPSSAYATENKILNNRIIRSSQHGIICDNQQMLQLKGNVIDSAYYINLIGVLATDISGLEATSNYVHSTYAGVEIRDLNENGNGGPSAVANNMIVAGSGAALSLQNFQEVGIYHNSAMGSAGMAISNHLSADIRNNILVGSSSPAFQSTSPLMPNDTVDYNLYHAPTSNAFDISGTAYATLGAWTFAQPAFNAHSAQGDPGFTSASDLHASSFLANNAGDNSVGISFDYDGDPRPGPGGQVDIGADEFTPVPLPVDVSLLGLLSPQLPFCPGDTNLYLLVMNEGSDTIDSVGVSFSVNGGTALSSMHNGLQIATGQVDTLNMGTFNFAADSTYDFVFASFLPNGLSDNDPTDDTLSIDNARASLGGTYTINATLPAAGTNYQTFATAATALSQFGVCSSVLFEVAPGTYSEHVSLTAIPGASAANTITFEGLTAQQSVLTHDGSISQATVRMNGADHITFRNLTIQTTKTTPDAWAVHLGNGANFNTIDSCFIEMPVGTTDDVQGIVASSSMTTETGPGNNANNLVISNSHFTGGQKGIHLEGDTAMHAKNLGNIVISNVFGHHGQGTIIASGQRGIHIAHNTIDSITATGASGIHIMAADSFFIEGNYVHSNGNGIQIGGNGLTGFGSQLVNNMIVSENQSGLFIEGFSHSSIYHNTANGARGIFINGHDSLDIRNNIFTGKTGFAFESTSGFFNDTVDFNLYFTPFQSLAKVNNATYHDLSSWQIASPALNTGSVEMEPLFVSGSDLHVLNNAGYDMGDSVGIYVDIDGEARPGTGSATVDIGADEMTPFTNDLALVQILYPENQICADSMLSVQLVVNNNSSMPLSDIPVEVSISGSVNALYLDTIAGPLNPFALDTVFLAPFNAMATGSFALFITNADAGDELAINDTVFRQVNIKPLPVAPFVPDTAICIGDSTALLSPASDFYTWFDGSGNTLSTDSVLTLPQLQATDTFYLQTQEVDHYQMGAADSAIGAGSNYTSLFDHDMLFTAYAHFVLDSLKVYPNLPGNIQVNLRDHASTAILQTTTVAVTPAVGGVTIPIGFNIAPGNYRIDASGSTTAGVFINNSGANYPYVVPDVAAITGNTYDTNSYFFFYDWQVSHMACPSEVAEIVVTVHEAQIDLPSLTEFCPGDSTVLDAGPQYDAYVWNTSETSQAITVSDTGLYIVTVQDSNGCFAADTVQAQKFIPPVVDLGPDTGYCTGTFFAHDLHAGNGMVSYSWNDNSSNVTLTVDTAGIYSVTIFDGNCFDSDSMTVVEFVPPSINLGEDLAHCASETFGDTLSPGEGFDAYEWQDGSANNTLVANASGTYYVEVTDSNQCTGSDTLEIIEWPLPQITPTPDTVLCEGNPIPLPVGNDTAISGTWTNEAGDTVSAAAEVGFYYFIASDSNGCPAYDTIEVMECTGIAQGIKGHGILLYPNPAISAVHIQFGREIKNVEITVIDMNGRMVPVEKHLNLTGATLEVRHLSPGTYSVKVRSHGLKVNMPFLVQ